MGVCSPINKQAIPVFFAADEKYLPFLDVSLLSLKDKASKDRLYKIHVLASDVEAKSQERIKRLQADNFIIEFVDVSKHLEKVSKYFKLRDYYTGAIYYRLFICSLFPQYDKALYMDCDTIVMEDVANLYDTDLGDNYIGAVADSAVAQVKEFQTYTKSALNIDGDKYFNSGVVLLNLKQFREIVFCERFYDVLQSYDFVVAPDQDVLNIICKGKVLFLDEAWNRMPIHGNYGAPPKIIHYNLTMKPWHYDDVLYAEHFWEFAKRSEYYEKILDHKAGFTREMADKDSEGAKALIALCIHEAEKEDNYYRLYGEK